MSAYRLVAITAGLRQPSSSRLLTDRLVDATRRTAGEVGAQIEVEVVELREYARDLTNHLLTGFPNERLTALLRRLHDADGLIVVSPIFSGSYSGLFKTFFDVLEPDAIAGKPVLLGATGGTARHSLALDHALRPLFVYLHAITLPTGVYAAPEDWGTDAQLADRVDRAAGELVDLVAGRGATRRPSGPSENDFVPFSDLLPPAQR